MAVILRSPRQASTIFDLGGPWAPRSRNLFFISFQKALAASTTPSGTTPSASTGSIQEWQRNLPFLCKAVDRPSIQPQTEELNQYNKRRQVYTGIKVQPMKIVFYDTADNLATRMWDEYAKSFFGEFGHDEFRSDFNYDVTSPEFLNNSGSGFGFAPKAATNTTDMNAQFFFSSISVYQVFRNQYIQFDIINPKITSFDPDDLSYEESGVGTITMTLAYEAIIYKKNGVPQPISSDPVLYQAFNDSKLRGGVPDFDTDFPVLPSVGTSEDADFFEDEVVMQSSIAAPLINPNAATDSSSGSLLAYGDFNFGSTIPADTARSLSTDLSSLAAADPTLAAILNVLPPPSPFDTDSVRSGTTSSGSTGLDPAMVDVARAAVNAAGSDGGLIDMSYIGEAIVGSVLASAVVNKDSPRGQVYTRSRAISGPNSWSSATPSSGITLANQSYGILNSQRSPCSQIGFNTRRR